jgi:hypothetical protein
MSLNPDPEISDANIVPFGKYRGQPVEAMLADQSYCAWALSQPGLGTRFAGLFAVIVNGGSAPDAPTPEHNRLQLLFRNPDMRVATYRSIVDAKSLNEEVGDWLRRTESSVELGNGEAERLANEAIRKGSVEFEVGGWDVSLAMNRTGLYLPCLAIELKPIMGDDYPAVLRKMKTRRDTASGCKRVLIVDCFDAESASLDDVKWIFEQSGIAVRTLDEIRVAMPNQVS